MKGSSLRCFCIACFLFVSNFAKTQPVITEYFAVREAIKIDLNDKKVQKIVYAKGILDIIWHPNDLMLSITYDPKMADYKEIWKSLHEVDDLNNATASNTKPQTK